MPEVTKLQQVGVNTDNQLIKLAAIVTKAQKGGGQNFDTDGFEMTAEERKHIMELANQSIPGGT